MNELLADFLAESSEQLELVGAQLVDLAGDRPDASVVANVFRLIHTLKGASGFLNLPRVERIADAAAALVSRLREGGASDIDATPLLLATVDRIKGILVGLDEERGELPGDDVALLAALRKAVAPVAFGQRVDADAARTGAGSEHGADAAGVSNQALDRLTALARELAFAGNRLSEIANSETNPAFAATLAQVFASSDELREVVQAARTVPAEQGLPRYRGFARELARDLGKKIAFALDAGGARIDRAGLNAVHEPLKALIRNALDHGIETPQERLRLGKPEAGAIALSATHAAGAVNLTLTDDGRGFNGEWIRQRLIAFGAKTAAEAEGLSNDDLCRALAAPELTQASGALDRASSASGLDRAIAAIARIGGEVSLRSAPGRGSSFTLRIPAKLPVEPAVIVRAAGERVALLRSAITRSFETGPMQATLSAGSPSVPVIDPADGRLAAFRLDALALGGEGATQPRVVLQIRAGRAGYTILVDEIVGFQDLVLEPLPKALGPLPMFLGVAALGDGSAVMVLDPAALAGATDVSSSEVARAAPQPISPVVSSSVVLFRAHGESPRALPISSEARILRLTQAQSLQANQEGKAAIDGRSTPVAWLGGGETARSANTVVLLQEGEERVALAVEGVIDVVCEDLRVEFANGRPGALGLGAVRGVATEILDPNFFLDRRKRRQLLDLSPKRKSILVVEPEGFFRDMLTEALMKRGFQVCTLSGVPAAPGAAPPGDRLVGALIDLDAAAVDNGAWVRRLRARFDERTAPPVFALAAHAGAAMQRRAHALGLTCAFGKFDRQGLFGALAAAESPTAPEKAA